MEATGVEPKSTPPLLIAGNARFTSQAKSVVSYVSVIVVAMALFGLLMFILGTNPIEVFKAIYEGALSDAYGRSEVIVKMIPFILCALAVAIPARAGLINVGGEGQLYIGAVFASYVALHAGDSPSYVVIPLMVLVGAVGGALWGGLIGLTRAYAGLNETISSLLMNYIAILFVDYLVHGPWKDPSGPNWAYSAEFPDAARLFTFASSRVSLGIIFALVAVALYFWLFRYTRLGYKLRVIGGNKEAAHRSGIHVNRYIILSMMLGGGLAGIAGMVEVSAIQWRLRPGLSNGYGYIGFLVAWLAVQKPGLIVLMAALLGIISVGGDLMQFSVDLPASTINILMALLLFMFLRNQGLNAGKEAA